MSEYWKSTPRHHCPICDTWISGHPRNIAMHERSERHQTKKDSMLKNMEKKKREETQAAANLKAELHQIETAARSAMMAQVAPTQTISPLWNPEYASRFVLQPPPPRTEEERLARPLEEVQIAKYIAEVTGRKVEVQSTITHEADADKNLLYYPEVKAVPSTIKAAPAFNDGSLWAMSKDPTTELPVWINRALGIALWEQPPSYTEDRGAAKRRRTEHPPSTQRGGMSTIIAVPQARPPPPPSPSPRAARTLEVSISDVPAPPPDVPPAPLEAPPPPAEAPPVPLEAPPPPAEAPPPPVEAPPPEKVYAAPMPGQWVPVRPEESVFSRGTVSMEELERKEAAEKKDENARLKSTADMLDDFFTTTNERADRVLGMGDVLDICDLELIEREDLPSSAANGSKQESESKPKSQGLFRKRKVPAAVTATLPAASTAQIKKE